MKVGRDCLTDYCNLRPWTHIPTVHSHSSNKMRTKHKTLIYIWTHMSSRHSHVWANMLTVRSHIWTHVHKTFTYLEPHVYSTFSHLDQHVHKIFSCLCQDVNKAFTLFVLRVSNQRHH
jgi:hypothetical protein